MDIYKIPAYDEAPLEAMIDWLHTFPDGTWEGDECGIYIYGPNGADDLGEMCEPGVDYITAIDGKLRRIPGDAVTVSPGTDRHVTFELDGQKYSGHLRK